jgi:undecaprenyl phosphate-alpha-L-ara4N flippase subunit ArnE
MNFLSWRVFLGLASFGVSVCFYFLLMSWLPLYVATSFAGAQYIAVVVAARLILSEPIGPTQWVGIVLISLGIAIVGWSQR